jgi:hypothetical protein
MRTLKLLVAAMLTLSIDVALAQEKKTNEETKTEKAVKTAAKETEKAVVKAAKETEKGVVKAAKETEKAAIKAAKAV